MTIPWSVRRPELALMADQFQRTYPTLHFVERSAQVFMKGSFPISDEGNILDWYQIEVEFQPDYPESLPIVRETGGRIPRTPDRHVNPQDGSLCVGIPDSFWMDGTARAPLASFMEGPVRTFLLCNSMVENGDRWPFGEWEHGGTGLLRYYSQLLSIPDPRRVLALLECATKTLPKGHLPCPCKSGRNFRRCHAQVVREVQQRIPNLALRHSLLLIQQETSNARQA